MKKKLSPKNNAFTLIEFVVVLAIIGILAVVVIPNFTGLNQDSRIMATQAEMVELQKAIMGDADFRGYRADVGSMPATLAALNAAQGGGYNPFFQSGGSRGDYISEADSDQNGVDDILEDAWGTAYQWNSATGVITSYGPDTASGGGDDLTLDVDG